MQRVQAAKPLTNASKEEVDLCSLSKPPRMPFNPSRCQLLGQGCGGWLQMRCRHPQLELRGTGTTPPMEGSGSEGIMILKEAVVILWGSLSKCLRGLTN